VPFLLPFRSAPYGVKIEGVKIEGVKIDGVKTAAPRSAALLVSLAFALWGSENNIAASTTDEQITQELYFQELYFQEPYFQKLCPQEHCPNLVAKAKFHSLNRGFG